MQQREIKAEDTLVVVLFYECLRLILNRLDVGKMCITEKSVNNTTNCFIDPITCTPTYTAKVTRVKYVYTVQILQLAR